MWVSTPLRTSGRIEAVNDGVLQRSGPISALPGTYLRPGVLFVTTRTGGTLMDLSRNLYIALSPQSALIWSGLAEGRSQPDLVKSLAQTMGLEPQAAERLFKRQLQLWEEAKLISGVDSLRELLPLPKPPPGAEATEIDQNAVARAALSPGIVAKLMFAEVSYRRHLRNEGLAKTLVRLQRESRSEPCQPPAPVLNGTLRAYYALRRPFRQSSTARDCLLRSLALTAVLRRSGRCADLCIGVIDLPFQAHAWVEESGLVLNEPLSKRREYVVIGRF